MDRLEGWRVVDIGDGVLDVLEPCSGPGDPVILIGTALVADRLVPVGRSPALADRHRVIAYRLRGYGGSSRAARHGSLGDDARDCLALMDALDLRRAAVAGFAYGAAVALQVAADAPERVTGLCLIEPPPMQAECSSEYRTANAELLAEYEAIGAWPAADRYLRRLIGRDWREVLGRVLPGAEDRLRADAGSFFEVSLPRLMAWRFTHHMAVRVAAPTLLMTGGASVRWFAEEASELRRWLPRARTAVIEGAGHALLVTDPDRVADALAGFLARGAEGAAPSHECKAQEDKAQEDTAHDGTTHARMVGAVARQHAT